MFKFILYFICAISILPEYTFASLIDHIQLCRYTIQDGNICRNDKIYRTSGSDLTLEQSVKNIDKVIEKVFKEKWLSKGTESGETENKKSQSYALEIMRYITENNKNIGDMTLQLAAFYALPLLLIRDNQLDRFEHEKLNLYNYFRCHSAVVDIQNIGNNLKQYFFHKAVDSCSYIELTYNVQCKDSLNKYLNVKIDEKSLIKNKTFTDYWNINEFFNKNCDVDGELKSQTVSGKKLRQDILVSSLDAYRDKIKCSYIKQIEYKDGIRGALIVTYNDNQETVLKVEPKFIQKSYDNYRYLIRNLPNAITISHVYVHGECTKDHRFTWKQNSVSEIYTFKQAYESSSFFVVKQSPKVECITFQPYVKYMSGLEALQSEHAVDAAKAFGKLVGGLVEHNIVHEDLHLNNWLYNPEDKKCYLIDIDTTRIRSWTNLHKDILDDYIENMTNILRAHLQSYTEISQDTKKYLALIVNFYDLYLIRFTMDRPHGRGDLYKYVLTLNLETVNSNYF